MCVLTYVCHTLHCATLCGVTYYRYLITTNYIFICYHTYTKYPHLFLHTKQCAYKHMKTYNRVVTILPWVVIIAGIVLMGIMSSCTTRVKPTWNYNFHIVEIHTYGSLPSCDTTYLHDVHGYVKIELIDSCKYYDTRYNKFYRVIN